jgi:integral membrane sensor domain MASE1
MADQASVSGGTPTPRSNGSPEGRVVGGIAEFGNDIVTLAELQLQLARYDLRECLGHALIPLGLLAVGLIILLGTVPVALLGVAALLATALKISSGAAMLLTAGVVLILALIVMIVAGLRLIPSFSSFRRSQEEFSRNLAWVRTVVLYSGRSVPRRRF